MASKRDYYEVLGVARTAGEAEIKKAFRRLALENHPDRNAGDAAAEQRFKDVAEAYAVLGDPGKRQRYDQFGHAGVNGTSGGGGFGNVEDIFAAFGDLFGGGGRGSFFDFFGGGGGRGRARRGASLRVDLELTLEEVALGVKKTLDIARMEACENCAGSGAKPGTTPKPCTACGGSGQLVRNQGFVQLRQTCGTCGGQGTVVTDPCARCHGRGLQPRKVPITVTIPAGIEDGHVERIGGQGEPGEGGGPPGDLVVVIHVAPHEVFTRHGDDLLAQVRITFRQAVVGDSVELTTIVGESVSLRIPPGTQPGERLRLRSHGLPRADGYGRGNLLVQVQVEVPAKVSAEQEELLRQFDELEQKRKKSPRKKGIFEKVKDIFQ